jgi:hypothetical protein
LMPLGNVGFLFPTRFHHHSIIGHSRIRPMDLPWKSVSSSHWMDTQMIIQRGFC